MRVKDMTSGISIIQNEYKQRRRQEYIPRVKKHL